MSAHAPVIVITGPPTAGKTTVGRAAAKALGAALIDRDTFLGPLAAVALAEAGQQPGDLDSDLGRRLSTAAYAAAEAMAAEIHAAGCPVVLVAPYSARIQRGWRAELAGRLGASPIVVFIESALPLIEARMRYRAEPRDIAALENWERFVSLVCLHPPYDTHLALDARESVGEMVWQVLARVRD